MIVGGATAMGFALLPLVSGVALYSDTDGLVPGRGFSPLFLVPGAASATAGALLLIVGLTRRGDHDDASSAALQVDVGPQQVGVRGSF